MTTLSFVTLTLDKYDATGNPVTQGQARCHTSAPVTVPGGGSFPAPVTVSFEAAATAPSVRLLACDTPGSQPAGWFWVITYDWVPGAPAADAVSVLAADGPSQYLSSLAPPQGVMPAPSGTPVAGQVPVFTGIGYATVPGSSSGADGGIASGIDGGTAGTGRFPSGWFDGGTARSGLYPSGGIDGGTAARVRLSAYDGGTAGGIPATAFDGGSAAGGLVPVGIVDGGDA